MSQALEMKSEIAQLCRLVLLYEKSVAQQRQKLFFKFSLTGQIIWNQAFGSAESIQFNDLYSYLLKNNKKVTKQQCQILCHEYSSNRSQSLTKQNFSQLFLPKTSAFVSPILKFRQSHNPFSSHPTLHFLAVETILFIIMKTIDYLKYVKKMRRNIKKHKDNFNKFELKEVSWQYLQLYMIEVMPETKGEQWKIVIEHAVKGNRNREKGFYMFFLGQYGEEQEKEEKQQKRKNGTGQLKDKKEKVRKNPIGSIGIVVDDPPQKNSLQDYFLSSKIWAYGKNYKQHNRPLYLL